ncbi:MAG: polyprenyl synthetase family protein [Spirochaetales bacterium]|nr:polyprenyl synthetase family protein [Spirochaetales bacterium]
MRPFSWDSASLDAKLSQTRAFLEDEAARAEPFVGKPISQSLARHGKMIRGALVFATALGDGDSREDPLPFAAALEMLHMASLIHDDVIDGATMRRGQRALHHQVGIPQAILAGDWLLSRALRLAGEQYSPDLFQFMTQCIEELCQSEIVQDQERGRGTWDRRAYFQRIDGKTAALFRLACRAGAHLSSQTSLDLEQLDRFALSLGRVFQMSDDLLDYWTGVQDGKRCGVDLRSGVVSFPLLVALEHWPQIFEPLVARLTAQNRLIQRQIQRQLIKHGGLVRSWQEIHSSFEQVHALAQELSELPLLLKMSQRLHSHFEEFFPGLSMS